MIKQLIIPCMLFASSLNGWAQNTVTLDSTVLTYDTVSSKLDVPWEIVWGPDDHIWFTERHGKISRLNIETGKREILLDHRSEVYQFNESGMLGLFLHPEFATKPFVYVGYTYLVGASVKERISRFTYGNDTLTNEEILIDNITGNSTHDGCRFLLLPDKTLLISTGDARRDNDAQNPALLNGKMLRMNLDGSIPADNPNSNSYVWLWGLRNTQGLAMGPGNIIYGSEHGPSSDDELNILVKGRNFGWPNVEGFCNSAPEIAFCNDSNVVEPIMTWTPTIAPSDLIWYDHPAIPEFRNTLVMTVLKDKEVIVFHLKENGTKVESTNTYFEQEFGRIRDICADGKGNIYLATNGRSWSNTDPNTHVILRLRNMKFIGVKDLKKSSGSLFKLFPNPSSGQISIVSNELGLTSKISVIDVLGNTVDEIELSDQRLEYSNAALSPGMYLVQMQAGNKIQQMRWLKIAN